MGKDFLRYDRMVEAALRDVVRRALARVAAEGLPGQHHFFITFHTDLPGVEMPDYLRERYPQEMTIVLQHQFWDLELDQDAFAVMLSFDDVPERLKVPFAAIVGFADPSVNFGLQFQGAAAGEKAPKAARRDTQAPEEEAAPKVANVVNLESFRKR
ncbi:MAG: SspB family protein [Kiloniellales bacterium]